MITSKIADSILEGKQGQAYQSVEEEKKVIEETLEQPAEQASEQPSEQASEQPSEQLEPVASLVGGGSDFEPKAEELALDSAEED